MNKMNFKNVFYVLLATATILLSSGCSRVEPNEIGVQMVNAGKNGKSDFSIQRGYVLTLAPGTKLYTVPMYEQRGNSNDKIVLKASDNTEFSVTPVYSYKIKPENAIDVVLNNLQLRNKEDNDGNNLSFMDALEDNILEPRINDILRELSRKYKTEDLMRDGGSLNYEKEATNLILKEFDVRGLVLMTFSSQLEFSASVTDRIDNRNAVNTNIAVINQQIEEQKERNKLEQLKLEQRKLQSAGLTPQVLTEMMIEKWDGKTPLYGSPQQMIKDINK